MDEQKSPWTSVGVGLCVDWRLRPPGMSGALADRGARGEGRAGTRWGRGHELEGQSKLKAMARAQSAGMRGEPLRRRIRKTQRSRPRGDSALCCCGLGTGQPSWGGPQLGPGGLLGVARPQTPSRAVLYVLNMPCQAPGKVWVIYNEKYMDS